MGETERAVFSIRINGTKEAVWREITKTDEPQDAFWHAVLHTRGLEPGNEYQMRSPDGRTVSAVGEVLACDPPNLLTQTLRFTQSDDPFCIVTYEIVDAPGGGVDFTMTVDDLIAGTRTSRTMKGGGGGDFVCKTLKQIVEHGRPSFPTRSMYRMFDALGPRAQPRSTRVEHWPLDVDVRRPGADRTEPGTTMDAGDTQ